MKLHKLILLLFLSVLCRLASAQELSVEVKINTPQLQKTDPKIFEELKSTIEDFLNNQTWTTQEYEPQELEDGKIDQSLATPKNPFKGMLKELITVLQHNSFDNFKKGAKKTLGKFCPISFFRILIHV